MKATLEFDLPEERTEHQLAVDAGKLFSALWEIREKCFKDWTGSAHRLAQEILSEIQERLPNLEDLA